MSGPRTALLTLLSLWLATAPKVIAGDALELKALLLAGDHAGLEQALRDGADPDRRLPDGSLPLAWAAELQDAAAVALLLAHGASPDPERAAAVTVPGEEANHFTPLLVACLNPDEAVLHALLDAGAEVRSRSADGIDALALCAGRAPTSVVRRMLDAGAPVDGSSADGQTPLMWAAAHARPATFDLLLARGAQLDRETARGFTALFFAIKSGVPAMAERALAAGADPAHRSADGTSALQLALYQAHFAFAKTLLAAHADAFSLDAHDVNGRQPLHVAARSGDVELVAELLDAGADATALTVPSAVRWRYESNFRAGEYHWPIAPPIYLAALAGRADNLEVLVRAGADPAWRSEDGDTLLHAAVSSGRPEALVAALAVLPDPNVAGARGETPLHRVVTRVTGSALETMLASLAAHGARADVPDEAGRTAASLAADEHFGARARFASLFTTAGETGP